MARHNLDTPSQTRLLQISGHVPSLCLSQAHSLPGQPNSVPAPRDSPSPDLPPASCPNAGYTAQQRETKAWATKKDAASRAHPEQKPLQPPYDPTELHHETDCCANIQNLFVFVSNSQDLSVSVLPPRPWLLMCTSVFLHFSFSSTCHRVSHLWLCKINVCSTVRTGC